MSGSDYTTTPKLGLFKPTFDADVDQWGLHLNSNFSVLDNTLPLSGGTVSGQLTVYQDRHGTFATPTLYVHGSLDGQAQQPMGNWTQIGIDNDYADAAATGGPGGVNYLYIGGTMKPGFSGNRNGVEAFMYVNGTPGANATQQFIVPIAGWGVADVPDNGQNNSIFGANFLARLQGSATGWGGLCGLEIDIEAHSGTSVGLKEGFKVVLSALDAVQGSQVDAAVTLAMETGGTSGWKTGYSFGSPAGIWPILATGTMIGTLPTSRGGRAYSAAYGVDFSQVAFSGAAFQSQGFAVNGGGGIALSNAATSYTDVTHHISLNGQTATVGMNLYGGGLNLVVGAGGAFNFLIGGTSVGSISAGGVEMPIGGSAPVSGAFTTLSASSTMTSNGGLVANSGMNFGGQVAPGGATDLSKHINLFVGAGYGFSVTGGFLNYVAGSGAVHAFYVGTTQVGSIGTNGIMTGPAGSPTWTSGSAAPAATAPVGSLYSRVGGAVGATLYVSRGGGTWNAVAGV